MSMPHAGAADDSCRYRNSRVVYVLNKTYDMNADRVMMERNEARAQSRKRVVAK